MLLISLAVLIYSVILHEIAHGKVADHLGDPTARLAGRLTLDPRPHIDMIGSVFVPLFLLITGSPILFGWARPVPFDPYNLKNPRRDSALISLAGPATNLSLAILASILLRLIVFFNLPIIGIIGPVLLAIIFVNVVLGIFNLLPIAPLDGFKVVGGLLSERQAREWYGLERYGFIFIIVLLFIPIGGSTMLSLVIGPVVEFIINFLVPASLQTGLM